MPTPHRQRMVEAGLAPPHHSEQKKAGRKLTKEQAEDVQEKWTAATKSKKEPKK